MKRVITAQKVFFSEGNTIPYTFRKAQLNKLNQMLLTHESSIYEALRQDLNKSKHETLTTELGILYTEINFTLHRLKSWMQDQKVPAPLTHKGTKGKITSEPYGTVLVLAPWNYPLQLALAPVIGAIAAGNTVVLKPSELAPATSNLLSKMIRDTYEPAYITVIEGDKRASEALLAERFDYIFFTGSTAVGKIVMEKASRHLTPVTLELGGKSPAIVDRDAKLSLAAKRLVWGKYTNAGQTCVAPDYIYVHEKVYAKFLRHVKKEIRTLYGKNPLANEEYVRIIHPRHFARLEQFLQQGTILLGGERDSTSLKFAPTVIGDVTWEDPVMQEEIFGPILPVLCFRKLDAVIQTIQEQEKPLALYYFGANKKRENAVTRSISFGGGCVNDSLYHLANPHLPFGGVGHSGMGSYHGKASFDTFTHYKSILKQTTAFDIPVRYPGSRLAFEAAKKLFRS